VIQNKNAETVADTIFKEWLCKYGIPAQIHTDAGKEFINKLAAEMMQLINVPHTKTSPAHPQCNAQVEVFNKTVKKYLASFVNDTALNYHSVTIPATTPPLHSFPHSLMKTSRKFTMAKLLLLNALICSKKYAKLPMNMG